MITHIQEKIYLTRQLVIKSKNKQTKMTGEDKREEHTNETPL